MKDFFMMKKPYKSLGGFTRFKNQFYLLLAGRAKAINFEFVIIYHILL